MQLHEHGMRQLLQKISNAILMISTICLLLDIITRLFLKNTLKFHNYTDNILMVTKAACY